MSDPLEESENRKLNGGEGSEQLDWNSKVMTFTDSVLTNNDTLDESKNREQNDSNVETGKQTVEVNMLTGTVHTEVDSIDESGNRLEVVIPETDGTK